MALYFDSEDEPGPHGAFVAADVGGRAMSPAFGVKGRLQK